MEGISSLLLLPIVSNLILGGIVLHRDSRDKTFQLFFALCALITLWAVATLVYVDDQSLFFARLSFALGVWILTVAVFFARNYPTKQGLPLTWRAGVLTASTLLSVLSLTRVVLASFPRVVFGPLLPLYVVYFFALFAATLATFIVQYRQSYGHQRQILLFVLLSCCLSILWGTIFDLVVPVIRGGVSYNLIGVWAAPILTVGIAYTIIRHRLFNLQLQTQRLVNILVPAAVTTALAVAVGFTLSRPGLLLNPYVGAALMVSTIVLYEALRRLFTKTWVGYFLFHRTYRFHQRLAKLAANLSGYAELDALAGAIKRAFTIDRYLSGFGLFIVTNQSERAWFSHKVTVLDFAKLAVLSDPALHAELFDHLVQTKEPLVVDELPYYRPSVSPELLTAIADLAGGVCLPLLVAADMAGVIVLGPKAGRRAYTSEDIAVLKALMPTLAIALTKARLLSEYQERTSQLARDKANLAADVGELRRIKSTFLDIVDHQFNTPLSIVKSAIAMIREGDVQLSEVKSFLDATWPRVEEFDQIVAGMLRAAHLDGDRAELKFAPFDLNAVVRKVIEEAAPLAGERKVRVEFKLAPSLPRVLSDPEFFRAAVKELVNNAFIYGQGAAVTVQTQTANGRILLTIHDSGRGFDPNEAKHIGEKFYRGPHIADYLANGSGLGVFTAKRVVEASAGELRWESQGPMKGATFAVEMPPAPELVRETMQRPL